MILAPYRFETTFTRVPFANMALIAVTSLIFFLPEQIFSAADQEAFVLRNWDAAGLLGNMFLHGGFLHLFGNMLFLWIFGNAVCSSVGNAAYIVLYLCLGVFAGAVHLSISAHPAIGASGAINGIVGMALVLYPRNKVHCWYFYALPFVWLVKTGLIAISAYWMVLYWLAFDILGSLGSPDGIAHWMHLGGLAGGMILGLCAVKFNLVESPHLSLLDIFAGRTEEELLASQLEVEAKLSDTVAVDVRPAQVQESPGSLTTASAAALQSPKQIQTPSHIQPVPTIPDIQLKRCVGSETLVTLYIVNDGAAMNALQVKVPPGVTAQLSPSKCLHRNESGWIRFSTESTSIDSIEFIIGYRDTALAQHKIRYRCVPQTSTLEIVSRT
jgi:membrane associated rhomboid family serine protease